MATKVTQAELSGAIADVEVAGYTAALVLVRYHGRPMGVVRVPCEGPTLTGSQILASIEAEEAIGLRLGRAALCDWMTQAQTTTTEVTLTWSVVVCTRDRSEDLCRCMEALCPLLDERGEIIVVDNARSDERTAEVVKRFPVRYVREDRPGLNWARGTGARHAAGEIVIYTDDDVVVDRQWVRHVLATFESPRVGAVTGMTMPLEQETPAQELFEKYGGLGRGFEKRVFDYTVLPPAAAGKCGAGANMAIRRRLILDLALFDAELDCGTVTKTGGDAYAFYRLLAEGFQIVYQPNALVWHRHRREYEALKRTLASYSFGGFAFLTRCFVQHGDWQAIFVALSWFKNDHIKALWRSWRRKPRSLPVDLVWPQVTACPRGVWAYFVSRRHERAKLQSKASDPDEPAATTHHARVTPLATEAHA